jgi:pimeloyl-ACP methyl ester carboxylesterase
MSAESRRTILTTAVTATRVLAVVALVAVSGVRAAAMRPPIVIVPGAPGTELVDAASGERVWPNAWLMSVPGGTDCLALPLDDPESAPVVAGGLVRSVRVAGVKFPVRVYGGLEKKLKKLGYRAGDWDAPTGAGEYFYFPYDWRQSVESSGRKLAVKLAELYRRSPAGTPPAIVLGHSLGGLVARYALMYGNVPLGRSGPLPPVTWAGRKEIGTLILVATPNEGTFIALKRLEQGIYYRGHRGAFSKETLFTFPSVFDVIPWSVAPLVDDEGRELPFRLDNPADWERIGWSVVDGTDSDGDRTSIPRETLREHLVSELARSARLRAALDQLASTANPAAMYGIAGLSKSVQRTAMLVEKNGKMKVRFEPPPGAKARLDPLLFEPGDSMVPASSLAAESSSHDPTGSLCFTRVLHSKKSHHALLSSPETLSVLAEVLK